MKVARKQTLDVRRIGEFRKDFLTLMKNAKRIDSYEKANRWREVVSRWNQDFDDYLYRYLLKGLESAAWKKDVTKDFAKMWDSIIRKATWDFVIEFRVPIDLADNYWSKEARYRQFEEKLPRWDKRVRKKAQKAWTVLRNFVVQYEAHTQGQLPEADVPVPEEMVIEGIPVIFKGHDTGYSAKMFPAHLAKMRAGMKAYKSRASKVLPLLLKHKLPIIVDYNCKLDTGGEYMGNSIVVCSSSFDNVRKLVHVVAHEMGHHLWRTIGGKERDYWGRMLKGDLGKLDLRDVIKKYGDSDFIYSNKKIMRQDPFLYNQLMGLEYSQWGELKKASTLEDIKVYLDNGGDPIVSVSAEPITGYANKNSAEAFCEAIGLLVAYGPRTVHPKVRSWLKTILPSLKVASCSEAGELLKIAKVLLAARSIRLDKSMVRREAKEIAQEIWRLVKDKPWDEGIGRLVLNFNVDVANVDGEKISVVVVVKSRQMGPPPNPRAQSAKGVVNGGGAGTAKGKAAVLIQVNADYYPRMFSPSGYLEDELYKMMLHELTHIADKYKKKKQTSQRVRTVEELNPAAYYNDPGEVRAYMQEVVEEVRRYFPKIYKHRGREDAMKYSLKMSDTWQLIEPHLNRRNRNKVLSAVWNEVQDLIKG